MLETVELDVVVAGAGVVGLSVGRALARAGRHVTVLESESTVGSHASSRNSEVIHAGLFYRPGSLKTALCVRGKSLLYEFAAEHGVPHRQIGKLLVAVCEDELESLSTLRRSAELCGVHDLVPLDEGEIHRLEPHVRAVRGLLSPSTGIIDTHALMQRLKSEIEASGGAVVVATPVLGGRVADRTFELRCGGREPFLARARALVNAGGVFAQPLAARLAGYSRQFLPACHYSKGYYFDYRGPSPITRLVYPVPGSRAGGIHPALDLAGRLRFGPDANGADSVDYSFDETARARFHAAVRHYLPRVELDQLSPAYAGVRPKLQAAPHAWQDFVVQGRETHGIAGLVHLFAIDTPGLTAALALGELVASRLANEC